MDLRPLIRKKREGRPLQSEEIRDFVAAVAAGDAKDYQMAALLMAIVLKGMELRETVDLTREMAHRGASVPRNPGRIRVGKHSTGGVGDKTTMLLGPVVSSLGPEVSLMSGRGLGHTGGTIDKLAGIAGIRTQLTPAEVRDTLRKGGFCIFEQTERLAPADRKIYALRDLSGTVESLPLIVSSILSKKWAEGLDGLVLDVKFGGGSFMGPLPRARELAKSLLKVAKVLGMKATVVLSAMEQPLGQMVGNNLEILECIETLRGHGPEDLSELSYSLSREMLALAFPKRARLSRTDFQERLAMGDLAGRFFHGLEFQGADWNHRKTLRVIAEPEAIRSARSGRIQAVEARAIGEACMALGAGRKEKGEKIDPTVGIAVWKKIGDPVKRGEKLAEVFFPPQARRAEILKKIQAAFRIGPRSPRKGPVVHSILKNH